MQTFLINGEEYELKLNYKAVQYLNAQYEGGAQELIAECMQGKDSALEKVIYAALLHTEKGFSKEAVEAALEAMFEAEQLSLEYINETLKAVVLESFFYKKTVNKLKAQMKSVAKRKNPELTDEELNNLFG